MGAAVSSNFSEQAQSASTSFSTEIKQESKAAQSAQNTASQECKDMKIVAKGDGTVVEACNNKISQGITAKQLQETIQDAQSMTLRMHNCWTYCNSPTYTSKRS